MFSLTSIGGRRARPIFLADRRPGPARTPAAVDLSPVTGRSRLSYERAEYLFKQGLLKIASRGGRFTICGIPH
jgi:hypothetical protein